MLNQRKIYLCMASILSSLLIASQVFADDTPNIFDWNTVNFSSATGITVVPHAIHYPYDWQAVYDDQFTHNGIVALMLRDWTGPYDGTGDSEALQTVMTYLANNSYYLNFVFADFESDTEDENCTEMVNQVRAHADSAINSAYIGNYDEYPGATDYSHLRARYDRTDRHNFYVNSGMNIAMPTVYPYTAYRNHNVRSDLFGTNLCVSIAHSLFWTPLEKYSTAKRNLPAEHILIPWVGGLVDNPGYIAPVPSKEECRALLQHIRLRDADGYYTWKHGDNTNYIDSADYRYDMYANSWEPLNWFFDYPGNSEVLNLTTNKTGGIEWSGMRRGNRCMFVFSNYTTSTQQVDLPNSIENIPNLSPNIAPDEHLVMDYVIGARSNWKLDENINQTVNDKMAAGNNGTITNAIWSSGNFGSALSFNGTDSDVSFGDILDMGTNNRSISLWFKTTTNDTTSRVLLSKGYSRTNNQHAIYLLSGKIYCLMDIAGTDRIINTGVTVDDGNWHHIALTIERNNKMKLYLNGEFKADVDISADATVDAQNIYGFYLGRSHKGQYFSGSIDEVKIFSGTLSEQEVYDEYAAVFNTRLDERQNSTVYDDTPILYSGTIANAIWGNGMFGSALNFNGTDSNTNFSDILDMGTNDRSISLWFKTTTNDTTSRVLLSKGYSRTNNQHAIYLLSGKIYCLMDISGTDRIINSIDNIDDGEWHHIVLTINRTDMMQLYIDGILKDSVDISADINIDAQNGYSLYLGRSNKGQYFSGSIDEVKIYNKVLDSNQLTRLIEAYR
jgi:concanavalin A-like lectin/glucanase superfamily protein